MREVPGKGKAARADGEEEEMDGGGILIISHSQGGGRSGKGAPTGVMLNSITPPRICERIWGGILPPDKRPQVIHRRRGENIE